LTVPVARGDNGDVVRATTFGRDAILRALSSSSELAGIEARVDDLLPHAEEVRLVAGEVLFREGDEALALYVVLEGCVQVLATGSDGRQLILRTLGAGRAFGEQAVLHAAGGRRTATVRAAKPTVLLALERAAFWHAESADDPVVQRLREIGRGYAREQLMRDSALGTLLGPEANAAERAIAAGELLFRQGDPADRVYLILEGTVAVYKERAERRVLIGRVGAGRCVGELALVRRAQRSATVAAETDVRVLEVDGARFLNLLESSPALREHMQALERVYHLPARGVMTQHSGQVLGEDAITMLYHLADGRRFAASRIVARDLYHLERLDPPVGELELEVTRHGNVELAVQADGTIVRITGDSAWPHLATAHLLAIDGVATTSRQRETFGRTGELTPSALLVQPDAPDDPQSILCTCVHVTTGAVDEAIRGGCSTTAELKQVLACATVCGGCVGRLSERLGEAAWLPVEVVGELHLTDSVRAFRLLPTAGRLKPWRAGQHVVVGAHIDGHWVDRQYTISAAPGDSALEITVKREAHGLFSNWLFDERGPGDRLRVSDPQGEPSWELGEMPALCFIAGIGVTPAVAACRALAGTRPAAPMHLDYSGRHALDLAYVDELRRTEGVTVVLRETAKYGRLTAAEVRELVALHPGARVYVCGPHGYLRDVSLYLRTAGVATDRIHLEVFTHAGGPVAGSDEGPPAASHPGQLDGSSDYEIFVRTEELLSLQVAPGDWSHPDELLFQIVHQSSELWLKLATSELVRSEEHLRTGELSPTIRLLRRAVECMKNTTAALDMLEQMSPWEYHVVRRALGQGSGFDSPGFCGVRHVSPRLGELFHTLREEAGLSLLEVYTRGREHEELYQLAEMLVEWDERATLWRMRHLKVVERILGGSVTGTQGTPVDVLERLIHTSFYPELWQVRNELTALSDLEPVPLRPNR
jgi:tryptophan 2,3-dioxygenase